MATLFQCISGGVSWGEAALALRYVDWSLELSLYGYIAVSVFAVLNVITGVFCSSAMAAAENDPELIAMTLYMRWRKSEKQAIELFSFIDKDGSGQITFDEMRKSLQDSSVQGLLSALTIETKDAWTLFQAM